MLFCPSSVKMKLKNWEIIVIINFLLVIEDLAVN